MWTAIASIVFLLVLAWCAHARGIFAGRENRLAALAYEGLSMNFQRLSERFALFAYKFDRIGDGGRAAVCREWSTLFREPAYEYLAYAAKCRRDHSGLCHLRLPVSQLNLAYADALVTEYETTLPRVEMFHLRQKTPVNTLIH